MYMIDYKYIFLIRFKCEYQIWSSGFGGTFIGSSLNYHVIAL